MKKHLVLVCGYYYPNCSPTATCAKRYISLFRDEYDIDVISCSEDGKDYFVISDEGYNVNVVSNKRLKFESYLSGWAKKVVHFMGSSLLFTSYLGNQKWYSNTVNKKLLEIDKVHRIDIIFSVCSPLAAHAGVAKFCNSHPDVRSVAYTVDPYSTKDRIIPLGRRFEDLVTYEKHLLGKFQKVLLSEEVFYNRLDLRDSLHNCDFLPYLLPKLVSHKENNNSMDVINCVYAGSFYEEIRNPKFMLEVFSLLESQNINLHLYSKGCESILSKYKGCKSIINHGLISPSKLKEVYSKADILIGIGNSIKDFLPSKTFEYMATCKPIVYFNYKGIENSVLADYPAAFQIEMSEQVPIDLSSLLSFLRDWRGKLVPQDKILQAYAKYSDKNIKNILRKSFES